jgi:hypothetical protein
MLQKFSNEVNKMLKNKKEIKLINLVTFQTKLSNFISKNPIEDKKSINIYKEITRKIEKSGIFPNKIPLIATVGPPIILKKTLNPQKKNQIKFSKKESSNNLNYKPNINILIPPKSIYNEIEIPTNFVNNNEHGMSSPYNLNNLNNPEKKNP